MTRQAARTTTRRGARAAARRPTTAGAGCDKVRTADARRCEDDAWSRIFVCETCSEIFRPCTKLLRASERKFCVTHDEERVDAEGKPCRRGNLGREQKRFFAWYTHTLSHSFTFTHTTARNTRHGDALQRAMVDHAAEENKVGHAYGSGVAHERRAPKRSRSEVVEIFFVVVVGCCFFVLFVEVVAVIVVALVRGSRGARGGGGG